MLNPKLQTVNRKSLATNLNYITYRVTTYANA